MQLRHTPNLLKAFAVGMFLAFAAAGLWLLFLAFEIGNVYPPYSSHRSELDGTQVLYESFDRLPELRVARHYGPAASVVAPGDTAIIVPGFAAESWQFGNEHELRKLVALAHEGARLIIALDPPRPVPRSLQEGKEQKGQKAKEKTEKGKKLFQPVGEKVLRVGVKLQSRSQQEAGGRGTVRQGYALLEKDERLPLQFPWRASCYLEPKDALWQTIYSWGGRPVLLEQRHGKGEIVLIADSFLLTNRAMWEDRHSELLGWLIKGCRGVVFYERHLGVADDPGIAWLIKRYGLDGMIAALLIVAALFVWRNSVPLVPNRPATEEREGSPTTSRGSSLLALVSRSLPASEVLQVCVDEWKKTERPNRELAGRIEALVQEKGDIAAKYGQIVNQLRVAGPQGVPCGRQELKA